jgi:undecaprenyl-diphosphatase
VALLLTWAQASGAAVITDLDLALTEFTRGWADSAGWPVDVADRIGSLTAPFGSLVAGSFLVVVLHRLGYRAGAGLLVVSGTLGLVTSEVVKTLVSRSRPPGAEVFLSSLDRSFPSGHAMVGIYLYLALGLILVLVGRQTGRAGQQRVGVLLVVIGPAIGLSRLVLGVHWPSDVLAGWAYGSVALCSAALLLWAPLDRGWARPSGVSAPELPGASTTPDPPDL